MSTSAKVLADSIGEFNKPRITTFELTFPRIVLAEFNTHRFSRNSASSRAIPLRKQIERVQRKPWMPARFPREQKGMQPAGYITAGDPEWEQCVHVWLDAADEAVHCARQLSEVGVHKQIAARLLEPFLEHTVIATAHWGPYGATWDNFLYQRTDENAQDQIRQVALAVKEAAAASEPVELRRGQWHLPLITDEEKAEGYFSDEQIAMASAGRCARVSYDRVHDSEMLDVSLTRAVRLVSQGHWSPFEHQATPQQLGVQSVGNLIGWQQLREVVQK